MALIEVVTKRFDQAMGGLKGVRASDLGNLTIDNVKPLKAELARAGVRHAVVVGNGATFKPPITAWPTTTATWLLYNGHPSKAYFIDTVGFFLASGTAAVGATLIAAVTQPGQLASSVIPTAFAGSVISNLSGRSNDSGAVLANAWTIVNGQPAWHGLAADGSLTASTTIGQGLVAQVNGGLMIPPTCGLCIDVVSGTGTSALYGVYVTFDVFATDRE